MRDYLAVEIMADEHRQTLEALIDRLCATGLWRQAARRRDLVVLVETTRPPVVQLLPGDSGIVIGDLHDAAAAREGYARPFEMYGLAGGDRYDTAQRLTTRAWGRYVALLTRGEGPCAVLRDPMGVSEAIGWTRDGLRFVASRLPDDSALWPAGLAIDWPKLGAILRRKALASHLVPLVGVRSYDPGVLAFSDGATWRAWSPLSWVERDDRRLPPADLARVVDGVVANLARGRQGVLCEISGGIDSAIVTAALKRCGATVSQTVHHFWPQVEGDERPFAEAVAEQAGLPLTTVSRGLVALDAEKLARSSAGPRPTYMAGDPDHDADLARRLDQDGTDCMFTGRGGDAVFYQMAAVELVVDLVRGGGLAGGRRAALARLAQRTGRTVWSLLAEASRGGRSLPGGAERFVFLAQDAPAADIVHPWLADLRGVGPAKRLQLRAIVNNLSAFRESLRHRRGDVFDPLLSQPVVETCLSIAAPRLALGPADRPFARQAFADRLPQAVLHRQGKGNVSVFFARSLAASLDFLRPYLLEGELAKAGLLDLAALDAALDRDSLIWFDHTGDIFIVLALEAWARNWRERIGKAETTSHAGLQPTGG
ncbi:asparagine synthase C-terminal domain-containing protein [Caulobacter sp. 602-1]|uniref:asparagine synthase C-terminal domain-containing protein n=1 Tax=Caulobacter sp. 602-1 TaxID=2492472 RepID=UPI000F631E06|nr:asparagine synthase C-terminal domain-containing protein [Caulobacter sp. 602-1]RRN63452.1 asparagine synthase [Caulobacter sp. 602-1]